MLLLAQALIWIAALAGIVGSTLGMILFLGGALSRAGTPRRRLVRGVWAALCACGIVASAAAGFAGVGAIMYFAQQ